MLELTGHVKQVRRGEWELVANLPPIREPGKRTKYPRKYETAFVSCKTKAVASLNKWLGDLTDELEPDPDKLTVRRLSDDWLAAVAKRRKPSTHQFYKG